MFPTEEGGPFIEDCSSKTYRQACIHLAFARISDGLERPAGDADFLLQGISRAISFKCSADRDRAPDQCRQKLFRDVSESCQEFGPQGSSE